MSHFPEKLINLCFNPSVNHRIGTHAVRTDEFWRGAEQAANKRSVFIHLTAAFGEMRAAEAV